MEESSENVYPVEHPETSQTKNEEDSSAKTEVSQPEALANVMKKLSLKSSPKLSARHLALRRWYGRVTVKNRSEQIMREIQSAFPRRRVRTLSSVLKDPVARMRRLIRIEKRQKQLEGNEFQEDSEPFRCLCTFCHYQRWDPSENAKIGKN